MQVLYRFSLWATLNTSGTSPFQTLGTTCKLISKSNSKRKDFCDVTRFLYEVLATFLRCLQQTHNHPKRSIQGGQRRWFFNRFSAIFNNFQSNHSPKTAQIKEILHFLDLLNVKHIKLWRNCQKKENTVMSP